MEIIRLRIARRRFVRILEKKREKWGEITAALYDFVRSVAQKLAVSESVRWSLKRASRRINERTHHPPLYYYYINGTFPLSREGTLDFFYRHAGK